MQLLKHRKVIISIFSLVIMTILLCYNNQAKAAQAGDYTYRVIEGKACITDYSGAGGIVTVPGTLDGYPVTRIQGAFRDCTGLISILIPQGVTYIDNYSFYGCTGLTNITLPQGVTYIGDSAFNNCKNLISFNIPVSVTTISSYTFANCENLTTITIPDGIISIENSAFSGSGLTSIVIPPGVKSIGDHSFSSCSGLTNIILPEGLIIGTCAFYRCSGLTNIILPEGLIIGTSAFSRCISLTNINIPQGTTNISTFAFAYCTGLTSVNIPQGVTSIGDYAFRDCSGLTSINLPPSVTSIGDTAFKNCTGLTSFIIPQWVTTIGAFAFEGCTGLSSITIPQEVTSIDYGAFGGCSSLTSITVDSDNYSYESANGMLFNQEKTILISCPGGLNNVSIPEGVITIGERAFAYGSGLTSITIPLSVTSIGNMAFYGCNGLTSITIPKEVTSIGEMAFSGCKSLTNIIIPQRVESIGERAFEDCANLTSVTFESATTLLGGENTIPTSSKIIGYDPSTAKTYAATYLRTFEEINPLQSITITTPATKLSYMVGDTLDITGLVVTGTYSNGTYKVENITGSNISGFDSTVPAANQLVTITVNGKTATYIVQIVAIPASTDATLKNLMLNGTTVAGFNSTTVIYDIELVTGTVTIPTVTATTNDVGKAIALVVPATALPGSTIIVVTAEDGVTTKTYTINFTVESTQVLVAGVTLDPTTLYLTLGGAPVTPVTTLIPENATNKNVIYTTDHPSVATVNASGTVTPVGTGTATITVTTMDGNKTATCTVIVAATNHQISFDINTIPNNTLKLGDDFFDMSSDAMNDPQATIAIASLLKDGINKNIAYFKFGGKWYAPFELTEQEFLNPAYALTDAQVTAIKGFNKWYKAGGEIVDLRPGTYTITPINQFSSGFAITANNVPGAAYFNIYKKSNDTLVNSAPTAIGNSLNSMPAVFSIISDLEVWIYSDAAGIDKIVELKLEGTSDAGILDLK